MAENNSARSHSARHRDSHSPNPVPSSTIPRKTHHFHSEPQTSPSVDTSFNIFRWVIRIMMYICLSVCSMVIMLNYDSRYYDDRMIAGEATLYDAVVLIAMNKTWHRKRMPGYLFWVLLFILLRSMYCVIEAGISWNRR